MSGDGKIQMLDVSILDREFRVACPEEERPELLEAVAYLDKRMREIHGQGKIVTVERIAIMAALNMAHELLTTRLGGGFDMGDLKRRINSMQETIDKALEDQDQLF